jgi:hypothetical protein
MVLTRGDDYPIHQTPEPVAYAGTDRNFYDRYFFNGYAETAGDLGFFAAAFGVYPHLNIADAAFCVVRNGVETALHASRWLGMERMDLEVGPIAIEVVEPLRRLRLKVEAPAQGLRADILFTARAAPIEEPRFVRRQGPRTFMDYTRLTQNGRYEGYIELDGTRESVSGWCGTRDRSWGVRPVGARDSQELSPPEPPQFFWVWAPTNFQDQSFFFHVNDDALGRPWNTRAVFQADGAAQGEETSFEQPRLEIVWERGTRRALSAMVQPDRHDAARGRAAFTPVQSFYMLGLGYMHPTLGHGAALGPLKVVREDLVLGEVDLRLPHHLHIQALCEVALELPDGRVKTGRGVLEQLALGPHAPSGLTGLLDPAA